MRVIKYLAGVMVMAIACMALVACNSGSDSGSGNDTEFKNESSSTVTVKPASNETFETFVLAPGESHTVTREGGNIYYTFTSTGDVSNIDVTNIEVLFIDPIDL